MSGNTKIILLEENKKDPSVTEIKDAIKEKDVLIFNAPFDFTNSLVEQLNDWFWLIYDDTFYRYVMNRSVYLKNIDKVKEIIRNGRVFKIYFRKNGGNKYVEVILRDEG